MERRNCLCGDPNCWDGDDHSWLSSRSGWNGNINGTQASIFFIHGRMIREQRHVPYGEWKIADIQSIFDRYSVGMPNPRLVWSQGSEDSDPSLWIEGEREPNADDLKRLQECRDREARDDERELAAIQRRAAMRARRASL